MLQQAIALFIIAYFLARLFWQRRKHDISGAEFFFWAVFWSTAAGAIIFIKTIDRLLSGWGFSASGIDFLLYVAVAVLFYLVFRLRLRCEKTDRKITKIIRELSLRDDQKK